MICARNLYIDFLPNLYFPPLPRRTFCSRRLPYSQICAPSFLFQLAFDPQFASLICGSPHYPTLYRRAPLRFFLAFFASLRTYLRLFPARPAFKFCSLTRSIRSGYERTCAQTPNFRVLFTRRYARILSKFYAEFQDCLHINLRRGHKRSLLRARTRDLRDTAREMKFRRCSAPQNFKTTTSRD